MEHTSISSGQPAGALVAVDVPPVCDVEPGALVLVDVGKEEYDDVVDRGDCADVVVAVSPLPMDAQDSLRVDVDTAPPSPLNP